MTDQTPDVVYQDLLLSNTTNDYKKAFLTISKDSPYLYKPELYYLQVESVDLNGIASPIMRYREDVWYITLIYLGVEYQTEVIFVSRGSTVLGSVINTFQQMIKMINDTFITVYTNAASAFTTPFMFIQNDGKFGIRFQEGDSGVIYFSRQLAEYFKGLDMINNENLGGNLDFTVLHYKNGINSITIGGTEYVDMIQTNTSQRLWPDAVRYIITSNTLPIMKENLTIDNQPISRTLPVLTNFKPVFSPFYYQTGVSYTENNSMRIIDMHGTDPIRHIDIQLNSVDKFGNVSEIFLDFGDTFSCKLKFIKKSLF